MELPSTGLEQIQLSLIPTFLPWQLMPHPATARLFINWLLSRKVKMYFKNWKRSRSTGYQPDPPSLVEGLNLVFTVPAMAEDYNKYAEKWRSILNLE
jgi:ABC-type Fe3+ transport system substrate-binding protein